MQAQHCGIRLSINLGSTQPVTPGAHLEQIQPPGRISPHPSGEPLQGQSQSQPPGLELRVILTTLVIQGIRGAGRGRTVAELGLAAWLAGKLCSGYGGNERNMVFPYIFHNG